MSFKRNNVCQGCCSPSCPAGEIAVNFSPGCALVPSGFGEPVYNPPINPGFQLVPSVPFTITGPGGFSYSGTTPSTISTWSYSTVTVPTGGVYQVCGTAPAGALPPGYLTSVCAYVNVPCGQRAFAYLGFPVDVYNYVCSCVDQTSTASMPQVAQPMPRTLTMSDGLGSCTLNWVGSGWQPCCVTRSGPGYTNDCGIFQSISAQVQLSFGCSVTGYVLSLAYATCVVSTWCESEHFYFDRAYARDSVPCGTGGSFGGWSAVIPYGSEASVYPFSCSATVTVPDPVCFPDLFLESVYGGTITLSVSA